MFVHKNFPVNINVDLYTLSLLILPKTCSKARNRHCTVDTLDVVHTGVTQSLFLKFTELPYPTLFARSSEFYEYLRKCKRNLV